MVSLTGQQILHHSIKTTAKINNNSISVGQSRTIGKQELADYCDNEAGANLGCVIQIEFEN